MPGEPLNLGSDTYDFIDLGCSNGGSLEWAKRSLGGKRGVGVDIDQKKVKLTRAAGFDAVRGDARQLAANRRCVSFVTMLDFLEHVSGFRDARTCVTAASEAARDFIFIRQPWFDTDGYLFSLGLKLYWSDWTGHPNSMTTLDFYKILSRIQRVTHWRLYGRERITCSSNAALQPIGAPGNLHGAKAGETVSPPIVFNTPVYRQIMCIAVLEGGTLSVDDIQACAPFDDVLFDSATMQT